MRTTFSAIDTGVTALRAFQAAQDVAGANISNISTKGYTRREAVMAPSADGGVNVVCVRRLCDRFAQRAMRSAVGDSAREGAVRDSLVTAEEAVNPLSKSGVYSSLGTLWGAFEDLSANPTDTAVRRNTVSAAENLASSVNSLSGTLSDLQLNLGEKAATEVTTVNSLLSSVADLNRKIQHAGATGGSSNNLRDNRDAALDELAGYMNVDVAENELGVVVSSQGRTLLYSDSFNPVKASLEGTGSRAIKFTISPAGEELSVSGGSLGGYRDAVQEVQSLRDGVGSIGDMLASSGEGSINAIHSAGYTLGGDKSQRSLFVRDEGGRLQVNEAITNNPSLLAASAAGSEGDGDNASSMAASLKKGWGGAEPVEGRVSALAAELGSRVSGAQNRAASADALKESAQNAYDSVSGVSMDEESAKLIALQSSYAAAAKFIHTVNESMDALMAML